MVTLARLKREVTILQGFYQLVPAYRLSQDIGVDVKAITRVYQRLREAVSHLTEHEAGQLKGEIELDEAYFGGRKLRPNADAAPATKVSFSGFWSGTGTSTPRSWSRSRRRS